MKWPPDAAMMWGIMSDDRKTSIKRLAVIVTALAVCVALVGALVMAGIVHFANEARGGPANPPTPNASSEDRPIEAAATSSASQEPASDDPADIKAAAVANGRPEAAFDEFCQLWSLPSAGSDRQQWANEVTGHWLSGHGADCPDAVVHPGYFVQSTMPGAPGELVATLEAAPGSADALGGVGYSIMEQTAEAYPELERVTAVTHDGGASRSYTRGQWEMALPMHQRAALAEASPSRASELTGQAWADEKMDQWLTKIRVPGIDDLYGSFNLITGWETPAKGELVVILNDDVARLPHLQDPQDPQEHVKYELQGIAITILENIYFDAPELEQVTAVLEGGGESSTVHRDDDRFARE
ncbi:hypothetical protein [Zhihengliuella salsuginis]|uniref:Uncharacterized protein n=1 Tax=Zhihengliuella salsuginis TaxID=578222 RepID=A0ABQ3GJ03_9MICC|nr:hypothetical protein [Zhihengliuella salsuginis]GHD06175.1 hypothetical protein GCM10008096_15830 [Zhihengliuella salsuginis]